MDIDALGAEGVTKPRVRGTLTCRLRGAEFGSSPRVNRVYDCCKNDASDVGRVGEGASRGRLAKRYLWSFTRYKTPLKGSDSAARDKPRRSIATRRSFTLLRDDVDRICTEIIRCAD